MALAVRAKLADPVAAALLAADLDEIFDCAQVPVAHWKEFFAAVPALKTSVPVATQRLLMRLKHDKRAEVRDAATRALPSLREHPRRSPPPPLTR